MHRTKPVFKCASFATCSVNPYGEGLFWFLNKATLLRLRRKLVAVLMLLGAGFCAQTRTQVWAQDKPNIIVILADDMGYGDAGCYNKDSLIPTPHLDKLAADGMRFTDAHSPSSVCSPTRYGLLTGRYAWRTALKSRVLWPWDRPLIAPDRLTVAKMLKEQGYHTACIGKWHLGWEWMTAEGKPVPMLPLGVNISKKGGSNHNERVAMAEAIDYTQPLGGGPPAAGFDYYFGDDVINQPPFLWIENDRCLTMPTEKKLKSILPISSDGPATPGWEQAAVLPRITEKAVAYIHERKQQKETPFFLYFPLTAPHLPIVPGKDYAGKSAYGPYGDFVHHVDAVVGQIQQALIESGQADNTLLIFTSDNGSYSKPAKGHVSNGALRGKKGQIFEGGHRVPFLMQWPGKVTAGTINHQLVGVHDLMATFAAILEQALPEDAAPDAVNLLPTMQDADQAVRQHMVLHGGRGDFALRDGKWKLVFDLKNKPASLYDLEADLGEQNNLLADHPERVSQMVTQLKTIQTAE